MTRLHYDFQNGSINTNIANASQGQSQTITGFFATAPGFATLAAPDYFVLVVDNEIMWATAYTAGSLDVTVTRGQEGTTAAIHNLGALWQHGPTALDTVDASAGDISPLTFGDSNAPGQVGIAADAGHIHAMPALDSLASDIAALSFGDTSSPGATGKAADAGHIHAMPSLDATATDIQPISSTLAAGATGKAADAGHIHTLGSVVATKANLPADVAYTDAVQTFTGNQTGHWIDVGAWQVNLVGEGADPSGATDSTAAINNAITGGSALYVLPAGNYTVSGTIQFNANGIHLLGAGRQATYINTNNKTFNVFQVGASAQQNLCELGNLTINNTGSVGGTAISVLQAYLLRVHDLYLTGQYNGIAVGNGTGTGGAIKCYFDHIDMAYWGASGGTAILLDNQNGGDVWFSYISDNEGYNSYRTAYFVDIMSGGGSSWYEVGTQEAGTGWLISPGTSRTIGPAHFFTRCGADTTANQGLYIGGSPSGLFFDGCWFSTEASATGWNVQIAGGSNISLNDTRMMNSSHCGILLQASGGDIHINKSYVTGCAENGIEIAGGVTDFSLTNNYVHNNTGWGIIFDSGATDYFLATWNTSRANTGGNWSNGATGTHTTVGNNQYF